MSFILASCASDNHQDLNAFIDKVNLNSSPKLIEMPLDKNYQPFKYNVASYRSPFQLPLEPSHEKPLSFNKNNIIEPDFIRVRHPLEMFPIDKITMVGTISRSSIRWALLMTKSGEIHKVKEGYFVGKNHGNITTVESDSITIKEIISNGKSTWTNRVRVLKMQETR